MNAVSRGPKNTKLYLWRCSCKSGVETKNEKWKENPKHACRRSRQLPIIVRLHRQEAILQQGKSAEPLKCWRRSTTELSGTECDFAPYMDILLGVSFKESLFWPNSTNISIFLAEPP